MKRCMFTIGELLLVKTLDQRSALLWSINQEKNSYQEIVDHAHFGEAVVCLEEEMDSGYVLVMSPRGIPGYINHVHISKSK